MRILVSFSLHNSQRAQVAVMSYSTLSPFRNKKECSVDEAWICNWLFFAHLHVTTLLGCLAYVSTPSQVEKLAVAICAIIMTYFAEGIFTLDLLDSLMAALQCLVYMAIVGSIMYLTYQDPGSIRPIMLSKQLSGMGLSLSSSSSFGRRKIPISTVAVAMHVGSSFVRVMDMTFGMGREAYKGDSSGTIYQNISCLAVCDMMISGALLSFALQYYTGEQHKIVLCGQAVVLLITQFMLASQQGDKLEKEMARSGAIGTFVFILVAVVGAL
jgi:hypothetical protein